jgi:hypothetical protein
MKTPEWMRETHFRFLEAAEALTNSNPAGKPLSLHTVCSQAGINDENECLSTMNDLLRNAHIRQAYGTDEAGMFTLAAMGRVVLLDWRAGRKSPGRR